MNTQQLLNLSLKELNALSDKELRQAVSTLRSTARKRYERIEEKGIYSPSAEYIKKSVGENKPIFPTVRNMDKIALKNEYKRLRGFVEAKTSTLTGIKQARQNVRVHTEEYLNRKLTDKEVTELWEIVEEVRKDDSIGYYVLGGNGNTNGMEVAKIAEDYIRERPDLSNKNLVDYVKKRVKEEYENEERAKSIYPSQFMQRPRN